jgi:GT2 family glycosyltransferase/glycosyltransferase involved in cell wall biosynthesis
MADGVSIIIPVLNRLEFTRQCLDRILRHTSGRVPYEVIVVDNASSDGTQEHFRTQPLPGLPLIYHRCETNLGFGRANNVGASLSRCAYLLFLNNDTLVQPGWLEEMVATAEADRSVGVVGIKQLFPYTNTIHHTGIIFTASKGPQHIYPFADASLPHVNRQREYQAVNGACLLISKPVFGACGGFDEAYVNGFEDLDLCMAVRKRGHKVVCCTRAFIYHYGQISEGRTADDPHNEQYFWSKWRADVRLDEGDFYLADAEDRRRAAARVPVAASTRLPDDAFHVAADLSIASAFTWVMAELVLALVRAGVAVSVPRGELTPTLDRATRGALERLMIDGSPAGGAQFKWSHYWAQYLNIALAGRLNFEFFVVNYLFGRPNAQPWDPWLQCLPQNHYHKLPVSSFCRDVLLQVGVPESDCHVVPHGYSREIEDAPRDRTRRGPCRLLTVTNSHDLERYGTLLLLDTYWRTFTPRDDVVLVVKDYGMGAPDSRLRDRVVDLSGKAPVEYLSRFTSKQELIDLYRSCEAFVSPHRGEGFGMKILDATACGLPVIAPLFGGPVDFLASDSCLPVDFAKVPLGDCLDRRQLGITNGPVWCEPDAASLARRLREVYDDPDGAHEVGERARRRVIQEYTWDRAAERLVQAVGAVRDRLPPRTARSMMTANGASSTVSPYWLGTRVSVVIATRNRKAKLLNCLDALNRQSVLPSEFQVVVVDDGSTDGTRQALDGLRFGFDLRYERQESQGAGQARNRALALAGGELVVYIGDDIVPHERLLEEHLLAHARHTDDGSAILGYIDWLPGIPRTRVMEYVCGKSSLQFAYAYIPTLPRLDYRFFYTSNISLKRRFLLDARDQGIVFDPCFRSYGYEDTELALRLERLGLELHYAPEALAYHDHVMNLADFEEREFKVGRSAVILYRKHPALDQLIEVRWIDALVECVEELMRRPELLDKVRALDTQGDAFLGGLARSLEEILAVPDVAESGLTPTTRSERVITALDTLYAAIFDVARTRGKVDEWFANVESAEKREAARRLVGCIRKLDFLARQADSMRTVSAVAKAGQIDELRAGLEALERDAQHPWVRPTAVRAAGRFHRIVPRTVRQRLAMPLRATDLAVQARLHSRPRWLRTYLQMRNRLRRVVRGEPKAGA